MWLNNLYSPDHLPDAILRLFRLRRLSMCDKFDSEQPGESHLEFVLEILLAGLLVGLGKLLACDREVAGLQVVEMPGILAADPVSSFNIAGEAVDARFLISNTHEKSRKLSRPRALTNGAPLLRTTRFHI